MAVPVFGPIALDDDRRLRAGGGPRPPSRPAHDGATRRPGPRSAEPVKALIITGDNVSAHAWKETTQALEDILEKGGRIKVDVTATPSKDLTDENLAKYDVLILNYKDTPSGSPESRWSEANKEAFLKAVRDGKGLVVYHLPRAPSPSRTGTSLRRRSPAAGGPRASTARRTSSPSRRPTSSTRSPRGCPPSSSTRSTSCIRTRC